MKIFILLIILILILWKIRIFQPFNSMKQNVLYDIAYDLGVNYLNLIMFIMVD